MTDFNAGVVMTVGPGRNENAELALSYLAKLQGELPVEVIVVLDGPEVERLNWGVMPFPIHAVRLAEKHRPGMEQPRNVGVRWLSPEVTHAWFLDSDILVEPHTLLRYREAHERHAAHDPVLIGPYELSMPEGLREPHPDMFIDLRWAMFRERDEGPFVADLGVALGCFGGNLVWPVERFTCVGGFHPQLHHGRCEDGELGLRAASHRIPMVLVAGARGYHLWHEVNGDLARERNVRDVPLLNQWHPWVQEQGLVVTDADGARFEFVCECGLQVNTLLMWQHFTDHPGGAPVGEDLVLPEGL